MAEDEVPLPKTKGSYNIDFDALDDSFNPFGTTKKLQNSPPVDEQVVRGAVVPDSEPGRDPEVSAGADSQVAGASNVESTAEKTAKAENNVDSALDTPAASAGSKSQDAGDSSPPMPAAETKPVKKKTKVVKKPKSRPVSKNLEGQTGPEVEVHVAGQPPPASANPADGDTTCPPPSSTPPQDSQGQSDPSATTADLEHLKPTPENSAQGNSTPEESTPEKSTPQKSATKKTKEEKSAPQAVTPSEPEAEKQKPEKQTTKKQTPEKSDAEKLAPESSTPEKSPLPAEGSESVETTPRREKSGGKVKKTKHKSSRRSGSRSEGTDSTDGVRRRDSEGRDSGSEHAPPVSERGAKGSSRSSTSSLTGEPHEPAVAGEHKNKHPAARVLEQQQVQGELAAHHADAASLGGKGESEMADGHSNQSVVKLVQVLKFSQSEWNKLKQELELGFQAKLLAKEREWGIKLADRDSRLATLEDNNKKLRQTNEDMRLVVAEFEKTISQLQSEKEKTSNASQHSLQDVVKERDQALEDLQSVETAFSDLHRRYEKTKAVVEGFKQNEEVLKKCVADLQNKLKKTEQKVQMVKTQAEEKLEKATEEIEKVQKSTASEIARLEAALRKAELHVQSQEAVLEQKVKENTELAAICDELIAKV